MIAYYVARQKPAQSCRRRRRRSLELELELEESCKDSRLSGRVGRLNAPCCRRRGCINIKLQLQRSESRAMNSRKEEPSNWELTLERRVDVQVETILRLFARRQPPEKRTQIVERMRGHCFGQQTQPELAGRSGVERPAEFRAGPTLDADGAEPGRVVQLIGRVTEGGRRHEAQPLERGARVSDTWGRLAAN